jgi:hypothetical protein
MKLACKDIMYMVGGSVSISGFWSGASLPSLCLAAWLRATPLPGCAGGLPPGGWLHAGAGGPHHLALPPRPRLQPERPLPACPKLI